MALSNQDLNAHGYYQGQPGEEATCEDCQKTCNGNRGWHKKYSSDEDWWEAYCKPCVLDRVMRFEALCRSNLKEAPMVENTLKLCEVAAHVLENAHLDLGLAHPFSLNAHLIKTSPGITHDDHSGFVHVAFEHDTKEIELFFQKVV